MMTRSLMMMAAVVVLAACGEKPQSLGGVKQDASPSSGTGTVFTAPGWKAGDKTSWESQMRARTQAGQNDYNKVN